MSALSRFFMVVFCWLFSFSLAFAAQALSCMSMSKQTGSWNGSVTLTNHCGSSVDMRNGLIQFRSNQKLNGSFWGNFAPLAYPQNPSLSSQATMGGFLVSAALSFPEGNQWWKPNSELPNGKQITLSFSTTPDTTIDNLAFYAMTAPPVSVGSLAVQFPQAPINSLASPAAVEVKSNGGFDKKLNGQWGQRVTLSDVPYGTYQVIVHPLTYNGISWSGAATPASVEVDSETQKQAQISYQQDVQYGAIQINLSQAKPEESLDAPTIHVKKVDTGESLPSQSVSWSASVSIPSLEIGSQYELSTDNLYGAEYQYIPTLTPSHIIVIEDTNPKTVTLSYQTSALPKVAVPVQVSGLPSQGSANLSAVDNKGHSYTLNVGNTSSKTWSLPGQHQYQLKAAPYSADSKTYYEGSIEPSSLLLQSSPPGTPVKVTYTKKTINTQFSPYVDVTLNNVTRWDSKTGSMQPIGLIDLVNNSGVKALHLAFITASNGCNGTWAGYPVSGGENAFGVPIFKQLKEKGVKLEFALGGLSGTYLAQACKSPEELFAAYQTIINAYHPDTLDFDVENNMQTNNTELDRMMQAILKVKAQYPNIKISFTLPVLPEGLVEHVGYNVLKRAQANGLDGYLVNIMAMDYGTSYNKKTMGEYAIDAATNTFNQLKALYPQQSDAQLWQRIGVTPMIGLNDTIPLTFTLEDATTLKQFANQKQMGLTSFWSINRDHPCSSTYVSITCTSVNPQTGAPNQSSDYQYAKTLGN